MKCLFPNSCGNKATSDDVDDTLVYNCTDDSIKEHFSLNTFRFFGQPQNSIVYIHCDMRVCLANVVGSACDCPDAVACNPLARKKRSLADQVDESVIYRVSSGPYTFEKQEEEQEGIKKEEGT